MTSLNSHGEEIRDIRSDARKSDFSLKRVSSVFRRKVRTSVISQRLRRHKNTVYQLLSHILWVLTFPVVVYSNVQRFRSHFSHHSPASGCFRLTDSLLSATAPPVPLHACLFGFCVRWFRSTLCVYLLRFSLC